MVSGTFSLDGETFDVDNNVWVVGDDTECVVIDAPHDVEAILAVVGDRKVRAILCTHAHDDHVRVAPALRERVVAPILLHPDDRPLWELTHTDYLWDVDLADGQQIEVAGTTLVALHTPGHAPGAVCFHAPDLGCVFTGDTLFQGGPGATGRSFSDADQIVASIRAVLFALPDDTVVHTGHGDDTTIGAEREALGRGLSHRARRLLLRSRLALLVAVARPPGRVPDQRGQRRGEEHRHHERRDEDAERQREAHRLEEASCRPASARRTCRPGSRRPRRWSGPACLTASAAAACGSLPSRASSRSRAIIRML